jgi:hypothetical protein
MEDPIFWAVLLDATEKTQAPFLQRTLQSDYWDRALANSDELKLAIGQILYTALKSSESAVDKNSIVKFLGEVGGCVDDSSRRVMGDYINDLNSNLGYHGAHNTFIYQDGAVKRYASETNNDHFFRDLTFERIKAMAISFGDIQDADRIRFKIILQYYSDIFSGFANPKHLGPLIKRLQARMPRIKRLVEVSDVVLLARPLTVISLRHVSLEMKKVIPLLICRQLYEAKKAQPGPSGYLNIIIDEAHNILSSSSARESEAWKDYRLETFEELIEEGRKFGVFLTIASQRPHDISETIISQLHNYFLHRLVNNLDILAIEKAVSYFDRVSFESLPILPTGTCVLSGISAQIPLVVAIDRLGDLYEPNNRTMTLVDEWSVVDPDAPADLSVDDQEDDWRGLE